MANNLNVQIRAKDAQINDVDCRSIINRHECGLPLIISDNDIDRIETRQDDALQIEDVTKYVNFTHDSVAVRVGITFWLDDRTTSSRG